MTLSVAEATQRVADAWRDLEEAQEAYGLARAELREAILREPFTEAAQ